MYARGNGVVKDEERALELFRLGCELNGASAFTELGVFTEKGILVPKDELRAIELYRRGCELGDPEGCNRMPSAPSK